MKLRRFSGLSFRNLRARFQRTLLTAIGIVLGVGIVFGVLTLSTTMSGTFEELFTRAYGSADLTVTAAGGSGGFDQKAVEEVRSYEGVESAAPRYSLSSSLILDKVQKNGLPEVRSMRLFGVEPQSAKLATGFDLTDGHFPRSGNELTLDGGSAKNAGLGIGDRVTVGTPKGPKKLKLVGLLRIPGGSFGGLAFGMAPLPFAQNAFDKGRQISGIAVEAAEGVSVSDLKEKLDRELGEGLQAERSEKRTQEISGQLQGFKIALLFFAGTSLFVGAFLVFNALSMTILERTRELGMLRALGSTRAMIARSVIVEAMLLGVLGSLLGVLFGYGMARGLVYLFGRAFLFEITSLVLSPFALVSAIVVGIAVTVVAALYPAMKAGRVSPVEAMRARSTGDSGQSRGVSLLAPAFGLVLAGAGVPWIYYLARNLSANLGGLIYASGIAAIIAAFLGISLVIPVLVRPLAALFSPVLRLLFGVEGRMAAANATRNRGRTALTASALMVGISLVVAFSALGGSLLGSIRDYLDGSLGSDYVVQPTQQNSDDGFSATLPGKIGRVHGVEKTTSIVSTFRQDGEKVDAVFGVDQNYPEIFRVDYAAGGPGAFSKLKNGDAVIGKQLAKDRELGVGSRIEIPGPKGRKKYRVEGILKNDIVGGGMGIYLSQEILASDFNETQSEFLAIKARPGSDREALARRIDDVLEDYPQFTLYSNAEWKAQIESDFNRQYVFFYAIMGVSVAVSAFGVVNTLSMSVFERTREIGILRAVGTTRLQIGRLIIDEGIVISLIGCLIGVALGSLLGYLFVQGSGAGGFEIDFYYPKLPALAALLSGLFIGIFAGLLPARSAARKGIVEAVQYE
ncbi:MAG: ABC transporter permease [Actinomycetota bacterium]|nr:ABC transporter permease [Rubrobacteraceae bacterium]MDQ3497164.1 ABC transporter permease [Actinomycetota bacterium]